MPCPYKDFICRKHYLNWYKYQNSSFTSCLLSSASCLKTSQFLPLNNAVY
ncbi:hypothetical protein FDUTEX481_03048 [Tolypothrix sp. PCC 7601]|nr:hypothetical protein FDUTEX481_03048 [Tolypothrix sp. PCC 7601]